VIREKDEWGESFDQCVNGVRFFAMGADYIPEDNVFSRITPERTRRLLEDCALANFNAIRVWGGGF
jgi:beta-mannosidase